MNADSVYRVSKTKRISAKFRIFFDETWSLLSESSPPHSACFGGALQSAGSRPVLGHCKGIDGEEYVLLGGLLSCSALRQRYRRKQASTRQG